MDDNTRLQRSFVYIVLGLLLAVFVAAAFISVRCYSPYSYSAPLSVEVKTALWSLMLLPSVVLPIALWLSNMLSPTLSRFSLVSVLVCCCFFIAVPRLYKLFDPSDMALTTSVMSFFVMACCFTVVVKDLKKAPIKAWLNIALGVILTLAFILLSVYAGYFILYFSLMDRIVVSVLTPILCLAFAISALTDLYAPATTVLTAVSVGYATLCSAFEVMNRNLLFYILLALLCLTVIWQIIDIIKYIRSISK